MLDLTSFGAESVPARVTTIAGEGVLDKNNEYKPNRITAVTHSEKCTAR